MLFHVRCPYLRFFRPVDAINDHNFTFYLEKLEKIWIGIERRRKKNNNNEVVILCICAKVFCVEKLIFENIRTSSLSLFLLLFFVVVLSWSFLASFLLCVVACMFVSEPVFKFPWFIILNMQWISAVCLFVCW